MLLFFVLAGCISGATFTGDNGINVCDTPSSLISSITPDSGATNINVDTSIVVNFAMDVDVVFAGTALSLVENPNASIQANYETQDMADIPVELTFLWVNSRTVTFKPTSPMEFGTGYTLRIYGEVDDIVGGQICGGSTFIDITSLFSTADQAPYPYEAPTVLSVLPEGGSEDVSVLTSVTMTFDRPMDAYSTEDAFSLNVGTPVDGSFLWSEGNTVLTFTPDNQLLYETVYSIILITSAMSDEGQALENDCVSAFKTYHSGPPNLLFSVPEEGDDDVSVDTTILLRFSKVMDRESTEAAARMYYMEGPDEIDVDFTTEWQRYGTELVLTPLDLLPYDNKITVEIPDDARCEEGFRLQKSVRYSFTTELDPDPRVKFILPEDGEEGVRVDTEIQIGFNRPMDRASVEGAFSLHEEGAVDPIDGTFLWKEPGAIVSFQPKDPLKLETTYHVDITGDAQDLEGGHLDPFHSTFETEKVVLPKVDSIKPADGAPGVPVDTSVIVTFNKPMDRVSVEKAFSLREKGIGNPIVGQTTWNKPETEMTFKPKDPLKQATYEVRINTDAMDRDGNHMADPFFSNFNTGLVVVPGPVPVPVLPGPVVGGQL